MASGLALAAGLTLFGLLCSAPVEPSLADEMAADSPWRARDDQQALSPYHEPWFFHLIREFFDDIDWRTIAAARDQIERFIHKVDRIWTTFRTMSGHGAAAPPSSSALNQTTNSSRLFTSSWWSKWTGGSNKASATSDTQLKEMLERVACFVGYVRLMNLSQEALAELDASKALTGLFSGAAKSDSPGFLANLFG